MCCLGHYQSFSLGLCGMSNDYDKEGVIDRKVREGGKEGGRER